jgi:hypothetical protein
MIRGDRSIAKRQILMSRQQTLLIINARYGYEKMIVPNSTGFAILGEIVWSNTAFPLQFEHNEDADSYYDAYQESIKKLEVSIFERLEKSVDPNTYNQHIAARNSPRWILFSVVKEFQGKIDF